ncbi:Skt5 protein [Saccharomycopsis crataegensis]|uniref:Skt5 protein n=1 Tax=Saccharomycopsis crataegensis TaxID=43959 RepID=A0AAV5QJD7_9ASCO|nr:Skt5 protein [Saccharomycopsis crataegensis]
MSTGNSSDLPGSLPANAILSPNFSDIPRHETKETAPTIKLVDSSSNGSTTSSSSNSRSNFASAAQSLTSSQQPSSNTSSNTTLDVNKQQQQQQPRRKLTDLSHLYLADHASDSQIGLSRENSHKLLSQYLGNNSDKLLPRMKTMDMYRENAKKSSDPYVIFQFAQYILQTALLLDEEDAKGTNTDNNKNNKNNSNSNIGNEISELETVKKDLLKEASHYLKKLSDKGYTDAQYLLADAYSSGALGKVNNNKAFQLFQTAAKHGHVESCYRTSHCYEEGIGTQRDAKKSIQFLKSAASRNHPAAMYKLGCYSYHGSMGLGKDDNTKKAGIKWLTIAVSKANELICAAPYELGKIYESGFKDIVIPDKKYALELYVQAASLGHVPSAIILGKAYELGTDIPQDANLSIHYYTQAAMGGSAEAMLAMCAWYLVGAEPFLPRDANEAFAWATRAANLGFPKAQYAAGHFLEKGIGCEVDLEESQKWIQKAARNGDLRAKQKIGNNVEVEKEEKECIIM